MSTLSFSDLQFFDPKQEVAIEHRKLPHWAQAGTLCFITFRAHDSLPRDVLQAWLEARNAWLARHGIDASQSDWRQRLEELPPPLVGEFHRLLSDRWHDHLDEGHGECLLESPHRAAIVAKSLKHFHGQRYLLTDFVIMPNHVHLLAAFADTKSMLEQCDSWKHFTATQINRSLARSGRVWQADGFDHLVRSEAQFQWFRRYIAHNPLKANLRPGQFLHESFSW